MKRKRKTKKGHVKGTGKKGHAKRKGEREKWSCQ